MVKLQLKRHTYSKEGDCTLGSLYCGGELIMYTCEDVQRKVKIYGKTAIPKGKYKVVVDYSPRFKCDMPRLLKVKGFKGIRIHWGNWAKDTLGCPLVGLGLTKTGVSRSKDAYKKLMKILEGETEIEISIT